MDINKALKLLADRNGSELFVTVGFPPCLKINKQLVPVGNTELAPEHVRKALLAVMGERRYQQFSQNMECNYAFEHDEAGRFRISAFFQKGEPGMVVRRVHTRCTNARRTGSARYTGRTYSQGTGINSAYRCCRFR